jgi:predicted Zn-ribbon and HTH transcriptional regulator
MNEKDRLGDKLRDREKAEEDRFFAQRDRELITKLKQAKAEEQESTLREMAHMRCPKCGEHLHAEKVRGVTVDACPACQGLWLDRGELEQAVQHEQGGWLARYLERLHGAK